MERFEPKYVSGEVGVSARNFVRENKSELWAIFKPLFPYIAGCHLLDAIISDAFFPKAGFGLFGVIAIYFTMVLIISWHRVVIHGPDNYTPVNPFKPRRSELAFMGMGVLIGLGMVLIAGAFAAATAYTKAGIMGMITLFAIISCIYISYRMSFYFPAKAVGADISLKDSFRLSKGYLLRLFGAGIYASWRIMLVAFGYAMLVGIIVTIMANFISFASVQNTVAFILLLPMSAFIEPISTVLGVTVLSNYYLYAMQNDNRSVEMNI